VRDEKLISEALEVIDRVAARYSKPRYKWPRIFAVKGAVGHAGVDEVGRIFRTIDETNRWKWAVTAELAQRYRDKVVCEGYADTAYDAASATEDAYDELMRLNWKTQGNA
jgi:prophage tail gpP-like protein